MKVCLFADSFLPQTGGMELVIHYLANALHLTGCNVTIMAKRKIKGNCHLKGRYDLVRYGFLFPGATRLGAECGSAVFRFWREHKKRDFDVINCHGSSYAGARAALVSKFSKIPLVMTPHGEDLQMVPEVGYGLRLKRKWDKVIRKNLSKSEAVIAISGSIEKRLDFLPHDKVFVIPNGIDFNHFSHEKSNFLHATLSIPNNRKIVLSVGRHHRVKGYEYGIRAFKILEKTGRQRDLIYVIVGAKTEKLRPVIDELALSKKIFLLPEKDCKTIVKCYQSAWCMFSPSLVEGLSLVSLEAMATGLPLVVTDVPGNVDIINDNQCGIVVTSKDPHSMAEGLAYLNSNAQLYRRFSQTALERVKYYDWINIAEKYLAVYKKVKEQKK